METGFRKKTSRATVKVVPRPETLNKELVLGGILKGLGVTIRHFFKNVATGEDIATLQYPEEKKEYPARNRGLHRLMHREDGSVRCVACMCCPTACPAHCITIIPEETGNTAEKRPAIFEIDELRCIVCGLCVEACPCDAIRMDTGEHAHPVDRRHDAILGKVDLMKHGSGSIAVQGGLADWRERQPNPPPQAVGQGQATEGEKRTEANAARGSAEPVARPAPIAPPPKDEHHH